MKSKTKKILDIALPLFSICLILVFWAAASIAVNNKFIMPSIKETLAEFFNLFAETSFYRALGGTLLRTLIAFCISFIIAFGCALLSEKYYVARKIISSIVKITRALPTIAVVLLLMFWASSYVAPIIVTVLVVFPTMFTEISANIRSLDKDQQEMCKVFGVSKKERMFKVIIPQISPELLRSAGAGFSLNLKLMVAAEVIAQTAYSMGYLLNSAKINFETATLLALVIVSVIIGTVIEQALRLIAEKTARWK